VNVTNDQTIGFVAGAVAAGVGIVPLVGYGLTMLVTGSHIFSLAAQGISMILMVLLARFQVPKVLKD